MLCCVSLSWLSSRTLNCLLAATDTLIVVGLNLMPLATSVTLWPSKFSTRVGGFGTVVGFAVWPQAAALIEGEGASGNLKTCSSVVCGNATDERMPRST